MTKLSIDLETASDLDLFKYGLDNYSRNARILMCAYAYDNEPVKLWQAHQGRMPADLREGLLDPTIQKHAFNAQFERVMLSRCLGIDIPIRQWRDTMVQALYLSLPGRLADAGPVVGIDEDKQKLSEGKRLIRKFCQPRRPTKDKPWTWANWETDPEDWALFCRYCKNDVEAERAIAKKLANFPVPDSEWELWYFDQEVNDRGLPVDMQLVDNAISMVEREKKRLGNQLREMTGLRNPMSTSQFQEWAAARGYPFGNIRKGSIQRALNDYDLSDELKNALDVRQWANKKSVEKFRVIKNMTGPDNRLRYQLQFYGAQRTGRWAGRGVQPHNLPRGLKQIEKHLDQATEMIRTGDYDGLYFEFGNPLGVLSSCIRSAFRAPDGTRFVVADLNAIETRGAAWVAGCKKIIDEFNAGMCPYLSFAVYLYGQSYESLEHEYKVLGKSEKRTNSKPGKLGCVYALGGGELAKDKNGDLIKTGLWGYAESLGVKLSKELCHDAVRVFREAYPEFVEIWNRLNEAAMETIITRRPQRVGAFEFDIKAPCLRIKLPSGRHLHYIRPKIEMKTFKGREGPYERRVVTYEGVDQKTKHWGRVSTHGGRWIENIVQAISRDILAHGMLLAQRKGFVIVGHVHDECIAEQPIGATQTVSLLEKCLSRKVPWAPDLPLAAAGYDNDYYKKG